MTRIERRGGGLKSERALPGTLNHDVLDDDPGASSTMEGPPYKPKAEDD
jgi:hypothetical protein